MTVRPSGEQMRAWRRSGQRGGPVDSLTVLSLTPPSAGSNVRVSTAQAPTSTGGTAATPTKAAPPSGSVRSPAPRLHGLESTNRIASSSSSSLARDSTRSPAFRPAQARRRTRQPCRPSVDGRRQWCRCPCPCAANDPISTPRARVNFRVPPCGRAPHLAPLHACHVRVDSAPRQARGRNYPALPLRALAPLLQT